MYTYTRNEVHGLVYSRDKERRVAHPPVVRTLHECNILLFTADTQMSLWNVFPINIRWAGKQGVFVCFIIWEAKAGIFPGS